MRNRSTERNHWKWKMRASLVAVIGMIVVAGCSAEEPGGGGNEAAAAESGIKNVTVQPIARLQISGPVEQVADIVASRHVDITAKTAADVVEIVAGRGTRVQQGDVVIRLDDTDAALQLEQARLALKNAKLGLDTGKKQWQHDVARLEQALGEATKHYNKTRNDYDRGAVGKSELDQAGNAYTNAKADLALLKETSVSALELQVETARLALEMAERSLSHHEIKAPIDGIVTNLDVQTGMTITPGAKLGSIRQLDPITIKAYLTEEAAKLARGKERLAFRVPGDDTAYFGEVAYLSEVIDPQSHAYELNLSTGNPDLALKPGMKVQVRLTDAEEQMALGVPTLSIVREGTAAHVFVYNDGTAEKRKIELGRLNGLHQEVLSGVRKGELLIVSGQHQLTDGETVGIAGTDANQADSAATGKASD